MTDSAIARRTGASQEEVGWGLEELQKPDLKSLSPEHEGRRIIVLEGHGYGWKIVNYAQYRDIKSDEQKRRETAERVKKWRSKQRVVTESGEGQNREQEEPKVKSVALAKVDGKPIDGRKYFSCPQPGSETPPDRVEGEQA